LDAQPLHELQAAMRIAILSDIHSNLPALKRALSIIDEQRIDKVYCLGDIVGYGGDPNECVELIRKRAVIPLAGNHDLACLDPGKHRFLPPDGRIVADWTNSVLTADNRRFLSALALVEHTSFCTLVHSSPHKPHEWHYILSLEQAHPQFDHFSTPLCFIGHTHVPFICGDDLKTLTVRKEQRFLINVGSVGQPRDGNPQLSFGIFDTAHWTYENIRADYDIGQAVKSIQANRLPPSLGKRLVLGL